VIVSMAPIPASIPPLNLLHRDLITGALIAVALGLIAGAMPAIQAMRLQIATALRKN
jgi:putative ABC transport system permease protein